MRFSNRVGLVAGSAALAFSSAGLAENNGANDQDLRQRVAQMEAELAQLKGENWLTEERSAEIRSIVQDVLADADTRASLLQGSGFSGHDEGGFFISGGENFRLNVGGQIQTRFMLNSQENGDDGDHLRYGFELSRTKLMFSGHVVDPSWMYHIETNVAYDDDDLTLEDAYIAKQWNDNWLFAAGQGKLPFAREELVHSSHQLAVERSLVTDFFTAGRSQGIYAEWANDQFKIAGALSDGARQSNTAALAGDTEFAVTARAEILFGEGATWDQFEDFRSDLNNEELALLVGGAVHYEMGESGFAATEFDILGLTADASLEMGPFNAFAALYWLSIDTDDISSFDEINPWGFVLQGGYALSEDWDVFGRYEYVDSDISSVDELSIVTFGVNHYISGHQLKWTTDVGYAFDEVSSLYLGAPTGFESDSSGSNGYRADPSTDDGQWVIRTQLQLLF